MPVPVGEPPAAPPTEAAAPRDRLLPWLTGAGFLILAAALAWVWRYPFVRAPVCRPDRCNGAPARRTGGPRRPPGAAPAAAAPPDLGPLTARVTALEQRPIPQGTARRRRRPTSRRWRRACPRCNSDSRPNLAPLEAQDQPHSNPGSRRTASWQRGSPLWRVRKGPCRPDSPTSDKHCSPHGARRRRPDWPWRPGRSSAMYRAPRRHWHGSPTPARRPRPALRLAFPQAAREALAFRAAGHRGASRC